MSDLATIDPSPAPADESGSFLALVARAAADPNVDVAKMSALLDMQERIIAKRAEAEFNRALGRLLTALPRIKKHGVVEYPKDKNRPDGPKSKAFNFAKWEDIDEIIRPLLFSEGFLLSFDSVPRSGDGGGIVVTGTLLHAGGHSRSASIPLALDASGGKNNLQGMGSTFSYGRRYTTTMLLNLIFEGEDDDGERGGTSFLDDEQQARILALIKETKADLDGFLDFIGAKTVPDIKASEFPRAINALLAKKSKMAAPGGS